MITNGKLIYEETSVNMRPYLYFQSRNRFLCFFFPELRQREDGLFYHLLAGHFNFTEAEDACKRQGASLAVAKTLESISVVKEISSESKSDATRASKIPEF